MASLAFEGSIFWKSRLQTNHHSKSSSTQLRRVCWTTGCRQMPCHISQMTVTSLVSSKVNYFEQLTSPFALQKSAAPFQHPVSCRSWPFIIKFVSSLVSRWSWCRYVWLNVHATHAHIKEAASQHKRAADPKSQHTSWHTKLAGPAQAGVAQKLILPVGSRKDVDLNRRKL